MKKFVSILILSCIIFSSIPTFASEDYISLDPYPYSTHVLGESLVIFGDTNLNYVTLGLYYPQDQGYNGLAKFIITISKKELKSGYVLSTETYSRLWPEGVWTIRVQYGEVKDELKINMAKEAVFDREVKLAEYEDYTLTNLTSYNCRGIIVKNNIIELTREDGTCMKIFSWNNLSPTDSGESTIFVSFFNDGFLTSIKTYEGTLSYYGNYISLDMGNGNGFKLFYWNDNLIPIS